jgi:hypothetical protein
MAEQIIEKLRERLSRAEAERDAWHGKSDHHYKMACALVAALRKELIAAELAKD